MNTASVGPPDILMRIKTGARLRRPITLLEQDLLNHSIITQLSDLSILNKTVLAA